MPIKYCALNCFSQKGHKADVANTTTPLTCPPFFGLFYNLFVIMKLHFLSCGICCTKVDKLIAPALYGLHDRSLRDLLIRPK